MSNTAMRIRSNTTTGINQSSDHGMVDAKNDDDDDELILVFPSGGGNDSSIRNHSWFTPTNNLNPPPPIQLRPRYIPPSTKLQIFSTSSTSSGDDHFIATTTTTNGAHFRLSPSITSRSIWAMLHHGSSVGDDNRSGNSSNQIHRTPLSSINHHGNQYHRHPPQFLCYNNSSSPRLDHHPHHYPLPSDQNQNPRSPDKTPITATIPFLPIIPSPPSAGAGDITGTPDHHVVNYDPLQGYVFHEDTNNGQVVGRSERSTLEATAVPTHRGVNRMRTAAAPVQQLPMTTATLAASLRMRKQQAQLLPSPKLL